MSQLVKFASSLVLLATLVAAMAAPLHAQPSPPEPPATSPEFIDGGVRGKSAPAPAPPVADQPEPTGPAAAYIIGGVAVDTPPESFAPAAIPKAPATPEQPPDYIVDGVRVDSPRDPTGPNPAAGNMASLPLSAPVELCSPHSPVVVDFDDDTEPGIFDSTVALRYKYRARWVTFDGPAPSDGGAILDESSNFAVTGYSAPNFLAFNNAGMMLDGGSPVPPETIRFLGGASFVQILAGDGVEVGETVSLEAYDANGVSLGSDAISLTSVLQPLSVSAPGIARVVITSTASRFVLDDLVFIPEAIPEIIDFDDTVQPGLFLDTVALRDDYAAWGVFFAGPDVKDGGAILDASSNFGVTGYSAPNFLAFNSGATLSDGGQPIPPEEIRFRNHASFVQIYAGDGVDVGETVSLLAFDNNDTLLDDASISIGPDLRPLTVMARNIDYVVIQATADRFVVDDLIFVRQDAIYIDFDEDPEPSLFIDAMALRDKYATCDVRFDGALPNDGGAILDQDGGFGVTNFSPRNFLAFNANVSLSDGGTPQDPEEISFSRSASFVQIYAGSLGSSGQIVGMEAFDKDDLSLGAATLILQPDLQPLTISAEGIDRVFVNTPASVFVLDNLSFVLERPYTLFIPLVLKDVAADE